jgi:hypothetical protein
MSLFAGPPWRKHLEANKTNEANFLTFLGNRRQFAIPIYQHLLVG